jgi:hypothetical protein
MKFSVLAVLSAIAAVVSAATPADYSKPPAGNPIYTPGLNEQVPVGKPYKITWNPTTPGKVSLTLLRGPSTNVVPIGVIADSIDNTGSYMWTPSTSLENDVTHYGLLIVVEGTGQYQWSTQFGIKNPGYQAPSSSTTSKATASTSYPASSSSASYPSTMTTTKGNSYPTATVEPTPTATTMTKSTSMAPSSTTPGAAYPTGGATYTPPTPSPSTSSPPFPGAGARTSVSFGAGALVAIAAVLAF